MAGRLMGGSESTQTPPGPTLTDRPWRITEGWDASVREDLKNIVENLRPETDGNTTDVHFFNVLLTGWIGSGKSSFYNSINSIFADRIVFGKGDTGEAARSLTKEYTVYEIKKNPEKKLLRWRICDTMGLDEYSTESEIRNLLKAVDGHVPNKHQFNPGLDFTQDFPGYVNNPALADKAHCIAFVIDANRADIMSQDMWSKLRSLREGLISRNIPIFILLSHIDEACGEVNRNVKKVYRSIRIRNLVSKVSKMLMGLPENQIFPIKNYSEEVVLEDQVDILLLYAMRQMLYACQGHIENKMLREALIKLVGHLRPETDGSTNVPFFNILLVGQIGSGKSSFYNSMNSIFTGRMNSCKANTGQAAHSLTKEYRVYEIKPRASIEPLGWRICDTMGLEARSTESEIRNLLEAAEGHVPNKYKFTTGYDFTENAREYVKNPTLAEKAHCVAIVINASKADHMSDRMWSKLKSLEVGLFSRNIPLFILLSHIDEADTDVFQSADGTYRSVKISNLVSRVSRKFKDLPESKILPIKNYVKEVELEDQMDVLLLSAMRQMLFACQRHIENLT